MWQRTFLHPSLLTFDAPTREECTVNRVNSNTPLQSLVLLNDPSYVEAAQALAKGMAQAGGPKIEGQIEWAFQRALQRRVEKAERKILVDLYKKNLDRYVARSGDVLELGGATPQQASLVTVARAILNLHELITRN